MKKFLSLLLALTMVLSLVVVPARAHDGEVGGTYSITKSATSLERGDTTTFSVSADNVSVTDNGVAATEVSVIGRNWSTPGFTGAAGTEPTTGILTASGKADNIKVSCTLTIQYKVTVDGKESTRSATKVVESDAFSIADKLLPSDIATVTFNGRTYDVTNGVVNISRLEDEDINAATNTWSAAATGYTIDNETNKPSYADGKLTVRVKDSALTAVVTVNSTTPTVTAKASLNEVISGGKTTLTATSTGLSNAATYAWYYKVGSTAEVPIGTGKSVVWTVPAKVTTATDYSVYCKASEGKKLAKKSDPITVKSLPDTYSFSVTPESVTLTQIGQTQALIAAFVDTSVSPSSAVTPTYSFVSANTNIATVTNSTTATPTVMLKASGSTTVTATATYKGKDYVKSIPVTGALLEATLSAVQNGTSMNYSYNDLVTAAQAAINKNYYSSAYNYETVYTLSNVTQVANTTVYGIGTSNATYTYPTGSGYLSFTAGLTNIGAAKFTAAVGTRTATGVTKTYSVTFNVPVKPTATTYADQYPEPVASYGNTYRYYVQVPADAKYYYVAGVNNEPSDWNNGSGNKYYTTTSSTSLYSLTDSNFTNGKCTLYVVTQGTGNRLYCGTITVYQKNYNINYNGVAGETVQFKHADFTNFMNEIAQARGDSSKNNYNNTYVTFNDVTFSMPSSAQGTLYYNGTAMSNSNSSSAFNRSTKVTNLDNITFVPNAKTSAKSITLNFTLHATKYTSYGNTRGTSVNYPGSVVISIVREDIKYTVAPGDSISFTSSDFQNFLRTQSGINYNHNVDYVTFDQSAVNSLNEGVLYNGYSGFSAVKATDKFYYTTTNSYTQNALSDVTFRASTYAKAGTTVYVPFTIYAKYGTSSAATRQVTGTVAIKIAQTMNFADVKPADYFYNPVKWAVNKNITKGTSATTFSPYKTCTRAEIVTFLWRDAGSPMPTTSRHPFTDVSYSMGSDFYNAILWANQNGITAGTTTTTFSPNKTCTRAEIVTFLWRYAKKPVGYGSNNPFTDVNKTDHAPYYDAILWAVSKGITTGSTTTTFSPNGTCTRGEAVTFLYRFEGGK